MAKSGSRSRPRRARRARLADARHRAFAHLITVGVAMLMVAWLTAAWVDPMDEPPPLNCLMIWVWTWANEEHFYLLAALLGLGGPLSVLAFAVPGRHRWWLAGMWSGFGVLATALHGERIGLMLEIMWRHGVG